jgi:hypothetical protein
MTDVIFFSPKVRSILSFAYVIFQRYSQPSLAVCYFFPLCLLRHKVVVLVHM